MRGKSCTLSLQHVTVSKVNKLLKNLKTSKSCGIDQLDNFCVKIAANIIDKPVHHIVTLSILQQRFPSSWKLSKVIPLHKKGCTLDKQNYRPVAILSPLSNRTIEFFIKKCMALEDTVQPKQPFYLCTINGLLQLQRVD